MKKKETRTASQGQKHMADDTSVIKQEFIHIAVAVVGSIVCIGRLHTYIRSRHAMRMLWVTRSGR